MIPDTKKIVQIINFFAKREGGTINYTKVIKLVYFTDKFMLKKYGRMITNDRYVAMRNGPVGSATKDVAVSFFKEGIEDENSIVSREYSGHYLKGIASWNLQSQAEVDEDFFSEAELEAMEKVYSKFGHIPNWPLCELTHEFPEWKKHNVDGEEKRYSPMSVVDFFLSSKNEELDKFFNPSEKDVQLKRDFFMQTNKLSEC